MPQFQPLLWINMLTWLIIIFIIILLYVHTHKLPNLLKIKLLRNYIVNFK